MLIFCVVHYLNEEEKRKSLNPNFSAAVYLAEILAMHQPHLVA
jgi:hypothetical protein